MASAEGASSPQARALFREGVRLAEQQNYAEACPTLAASYKLYAGVGTEFQLADCWEHLGKTELARTLFLDVAQKTREADQPERAERARARVAALESAPATPSSEPVAPPSPAPAPRVESVPEVIVKAPEPERAAAPAEPTHEPALPPKLREEYGVLADAAVQLQALRKGLALLARSAQGAQRTRELAQELGQAQRELDASFQLAGHVAAQAMRQAAWSRRSASPALKSAHHAAKPRLASELASAEAERH